MNRRNPLVIALMMTVSASLSAASPALAASASEIDAKASAALESLYESEPGAKTLADASKGILVFPEILKGGFIVGGHFGDGVLRKADTVAGYYRSLAASYGMQAGVQSFGYVLIFMDDASLAYLDKSDGWEVGTGPSLVIVDKGVATSLTTTTLKSGVYAYIFSQKGLMAGIAIEGTKITRIHPDK